MVAGIKKLFWELLTPSSQSDYRKETGSEETDQKEHKKDIFNLWLLCIQTPGIKHVLWSEPTEPTFPPEQ